MPNSPSVGVCYSALWRAGAAITPVIFILAEPELRHILADAGCVAVITSADLLDQETVVQAAGPSDFWTLVLGSGFRLPVDVMGAEAAGRVRAALMRRMEQEAVTEAVTDVLYARARRG